jgi:hypothetical protein
MSTCRTCGYWSEIVHPSSKRKGLGYCQCEGLLEGDLLEGPPRPDQLVYEGLNGVEISELSLYTGPNFGCVHWESDDA